LLWGVVSFGGCGPSLSETVPDGVIQRLPKASRRSVFQAETIVTIALDRRASVVRETQNLNRELTKTKELARLADKRLDKAKDEERDRIKQEIEVLEAKEELLDRQIDHQEIELKLADYEVVLAKAQFELAKVKLVKKHSIKFGGEEKDFTDQVQSIQEDVNDKRKDVADDEKEVKEQEESFLALKKKYNMMDGEPSKGWWVQ
jgi:hypothetical protein